MIPPSLPTAVANAITVPRDGLVQQQRIETYGTVTATISASSTAPVGPFTLQIGGSDGTTGKQYSLALNVSIVAAPLNATASVVYSNLDPVAHTGQTATLIAHATGGLAPFSYQWTGGGTWVGNRLAMNAPASSIAGTLTVTDSSAPALSVSIAVTIPVSPVVPEETLYAAVLNRINAEEAFGTLLDSQGANGTYFHNRILNQANMVQPTLTPGQYASLKSLAGQYQAEQTGDAGTFRSTMGGLHGARPQSVPAMKATLQTLTNNQMQRPANYLSLVQQQTQLGNAAATAFDTYAWSNFAPTVEYNTGGNWGTIRV